MKTWGQFIINLFFLPIRLSIDVFRSDRGWFKKLIYFFLVWLILGSIWLSSYSAIISYARYSLYDWGLLDKVSQVKVSGESMLPTIKSGEEITLHSPAKFGIERGDIVSFQNIETGGQFYLKRVIGLSGEEIVIVNGQVRVDGQFLREDYTYRQEPTYGNTFLIDCEAKTIPEGLVAVMGDNRIASSDSRVIGFIETEDIEGVIKTNLRIMTKSSAGQLKIEEKVIDPSVLLEKINQYRNQLQLEPLRLQPLLGQVAGERANLITTKFDDWKQNLMPVDKALESVGYKYLLAQEVVTFGYLDEQQVIDQVTESPLYRDAFSSDRFLEIGIGTKVMEKNQCHFPVITLILAWPSDPGYLEEDREVWQKDIEILTQITSALKELKNKPGINRTETDSLISDFSQLLEVANSMLTKVDQEEWLTGEEYQSLESYYEKSQTAFDKLEVYYAGYTEIDDPTAQSLLTRLLPEQSEFVKKSNETKLLFGQGNYSQQLVSAQELIKIAQDDSEKAIGYYWQGLAHYKLGSSQTAQDSLLTAVSLKSDYAGPYVTLSAISLDKRDFNQALVYTLKCVELDPQYAWCHNNLGLTYFYLGQREKGITELEKAVSLDPSSYVFNDNLNRTKKAL